MFYYINKTNYKFLDIPYYYKVNDIFTDKSFIKPSKSYLFKFIEYFQLNYQKAYLFKITLFGGFNSNSKNTNDVDLYISYKDISNKNYEEIYDCMYFLISKSIELFNIKIDLFYVDKSYTQWNSKIMEYCNTQNMIKLQEHSKNSFIHQGERVTLIATKTYKTKKKSYHHEIDKTKNITITITNEKELFIEKEHGNYTHFLKQVNYVKNGRKYYDDVVLIEDNNINTDYFKI